MCFVLPLDLSKIFKSEQARSYPRTLQSMCGSEAINKSINVVLENSQAIFDELVVTFQFHILRISQQSVIAHPKMAGRPLTDYIFLLTVIYLLL